MKRLLTRKTLLWTVGILLGLCLFGFLLRNTVFHAVLHAKLDELKAKSGIEVQIEESGIHGFKQVYLRKLQAIKGQDTLFRMAQCDLDLSLWGFLRGKGLVKSLSVEQASLHYERRAGKRLTPADTASTKTEPLDPGKLLNTAYNQFQRFFPGEMHFSDLSLHYRDSLGFLHLSLDTLHTQGKTFEGQIHIEGPSAEQDWRLQGNLAEGIELKAYPEKKGALPFIYSRLGLDFRADTLQLKLHNASREEGRFAFSLAWSARALKVYHPKISTDTLGLALVQASTHWSLHDGLLEMDSNSHFTCNHVKGKIGLLFPIATNHKVYALHFETLPIAADSFFASLPEGAFDETRGLKAKGSLAYTLHFFLDGNKPAQLEFESGFQKDGFRILSYPGTPLTLMNQSFEHEVYENGQLTRRFVVGPENPNFTPLPEVPQNLINAILCSEDPSFFQHGGFIQEAFRESIAENYRTKSFKRGGSTISMQLVKNVFLSRKKTVFRKIEEALIVWLIEKQRLSSKERMMEVYLNIIEWGPNVYGVKEASQFYFAKNPSQLSLSECIYLANIIPRPKKFTWGFDKSGQMKGYLQDMNRFILRRMVVKEFVSPADTSGYQVDVQLKGRALDLVVPDDSTSVEPEFETEFEELIPLPLTD